MLTGVIYFVQCVIQNLIDMLVNFWILTWISYRMLLEDLSFRIQSMISKQQRNHMDSLHSVH